MTDRFEDMTARRIAEFRENTLLSDREAEAVAYKSLGFVASDCADKMGIAESTYNEYLRRARTKANEGKRTWDTMEMFGIVVESDIDS
jgi:DNA-binding CsgD family transcriptional regulator